MKAEEIFAVVKTHLLPPFEVQSVHNRSSQVTLVEQSVIVYASLDPYKSANVAKQLNEVFHPVVRSR